MESKVDIYKKELGNYAGYRLRKVLLKGFTLLGHEDFTRCSNICGIVVLVEIKIQGSSYIKMILMMMATKKFYLEAVRGRLIALKSRSETDQTERKTYFTKLIKFHL